MQVKCCDRCGARDKEYYSFVLPRFSGYLRRTVRYVQKELCLICAQEIWHWLYAGQRMENDRVAVTAEEAQAAEAASSLVWSSAEPVKKNFWP